MDGSGFGLQGMSERAHLLGGKLSVQSVAGSTVVTLDVRLGSKEESKRA